MNQIKTVTCRHCGRTIGSVGFVHHLRTHPKSLSYDKELLAHGIERTGTTAWKPAVPPSKPAPSQVMGTVEPPEPEPWPKASANAAYQDNGRLSITREALELALSGLERVKGELEGHIADVRATLEPPPKRTKYKIPTLLEKKIAAIRRDSKGRPIEDDGPKPGHPTGTPSAAWMPRQHTTPVATYNWTRNKNGSNKRTWSNDPEGKYRHFVDTGEIMRKASGELWPKQKASPAALAAMAKARAVQIQMRNNK